MSDIAPDTGTQPPAEAAAPEAPAPELVPASSVDLGPLEARVDSLESRVSALEIRPAPSSVTSGPAFTFSTSTNPATGFDAEARRAELIGQGLSEEDANEQAAYEERIWNDAQKPAG